MTRLHCKSATHFNHSYSLMLVGEGSALLVLSLFQESYLSDRIGPRPMSGGHPWAPILPRFTNKAWHCGEPVISVVWASLHIPVSSWWISLPVRSKERGGREGGREGGDRGGEGEDEKEVVRV